LDTGRHVKKTSSSNPLELLGFLAIKYFGVGTKATHNATSEFYDYFDKHGEM
jgi:hypothetical protein